MSTEQSVVASTDSSDATAVLPPGNIDLLKLAKDTSQALEKLAPFYIEGSKRAFLGFGGPPKVKQEVVTQTTSYIRAIHNSIGASQFGHTLAEEAIDITKYILKQGAITPDLDEYFSTASDLAARGKEKAAEALQLFLGAGQQLDELILKYEKAGDIKAADKAVVKDCVDALMILQSTLDTYVGWWNEMEMKHTTIQDRTQLRFNRIRYHSILDEWQNLKGRYVEYNKTIKLAKSKFPDVFKAIS